MRDLRVMLAAGIAGVVGLALLLVESIRALGHSSFTTLALIVLYAGLGLIAVAGVLSLVAITRGADSVSPESAEG